MITKERKTQLNKIKNFIKNYDELSCCIQWLEDDREYAALFHQDCGSAFQIETRLSAEEIDWIEYSWGYEIEFYEGDIIKVKRALVGVRD